MYEQIWIYNIRKCAYGSTLNYLYGTADEYISICSMEHKLSMCETTNANHILLNAISCSGGGSWIIPLLHGKVYILGGSAADHQIEPIGNNIKRALNTMTKLKKTNLNWNERRGRCFCR